MKRYRHKYTNSVVEQNKGEDLPIYTEIREDGTPGYSIPVWVIEGGSDYVMNKLRTE